MLECGDIAASEPERQIFGVKAVAFKRHKPSLNSAFARMSCTVHVRPDLLVRGVFRGVGTKNGPLGPVFVMLLAEWTGLEPATPGVTGRYSNQLNYHSSQWLRCRIAPQVQPDLSNIDGVP